MPLSARLACAVVLLAIGLSGCRASATVPPADALVRDGASEALPVASAVAAGAPDPAAEAALLPPPAPAQASPVNPVTVVIDAGHGGGESGAAAFDVVERDSNLELAFRVERLLTEHGLRVVLTRRDHGRAPGVADGNTFSTTRIDLQARVDLANAEQAALFVSIHSNGLGDRGVRGIEAYYNSSRPFANENYALAQQLLDNVAWELAAIGHPTQVRGVLDDACLKVFRGVCYPLFVLGPPRITTREEVWHRGGDPAQLGFAADQDSIASRATQMPGALVELLFISNYDDAWLLSDDGAREALARGVANGILRFLETSTTGR